MDSRRISIENYAECLCDCLCDCFNITPTTTTTGSDAQNLRAHTTLKQLAYTIDRTCITYIYISSIECMAMCVCVNVSVASATAAAAADDEERQVKCYSERATQRSDFHTGFYFSPLCYDFLRCKCISHKHVREYYSILYKVVVTRKCTIWEWEKRAQRREQDAAGRFGGGGSLVQARISERIVKCIRAKLTDKMWIWCLWMWMCFVHRTIYFAVPSQRARACDAWQGSIQFCCVCIKYLIRRNGSYVCICNMFVCALCAHWTSMKSIVVSKYIRCWNLLFVCVISLRSERNNPARKTRHVNSL